MLTQLDITERRPVLDGLDFGDTGPYESCYGTATFAVDPSHPNNRPVVDLDGAPRDESGRVTFTADAWLLKPVDPDRGNGALIAHIVNRGRKGVLPSFNLAEGSNRPSAAAEFGDGFLMRHGFTVVACGWQADVPPEAPDNPHLMALRAPVATDGDRPITGPVASEIVVDAPSQIESLGSRYHVPVPPVDPDEPGAVLTVRDRPLDPPEVIDRGRWALDRLPDGSPAARFPEGFVPGRIYNVVYTGRDPVVMGLGFAATRDFVSFLRYDETAANPLSGAIDRTISHGSSQSGRFLRHLVYQGFNQDESGRRVLDGMFVNVAGAGMGSFNHRFAQPSRHACTFTDTLYLTEQFPFADDPSEDPRSGRREGLLDRAREQDCAPKIFYTNTSVEYWNRGASLIHTTPDGRSDHPVPDNVRIYHFTGTQHSPGALPGKGKALPANPVNFRLGLRALLLAMDAWIADGAEPPESRHATLRSHTLVSPPPNGQDDPTIPGLPFPSVLRRPAPLDFGPSWSEGIISREPPTVGEAWPVSVPVVDDDGNEMAGIAMPEVAVPLGTFVGWRYRDKSQGAAWTLAGLQGAWMPFPRDAEERVTLGDPRLSIAERYADEEDYLARVRVAAGRLVANGCLLDHDVVLAEARARAMYRWATAPPDGP